MKKIIFILMFLLFTINIYAYDLTPEGNQINCSIQHYDLCDTFDGASVNWSKFISTDQSRYAIVNNALQLNFIVSIAKNIRWNSKVLDSTSQYCYEEKYIQSSGDDRYAEFTSDGTFTGANKIKVGSTSTIPAIMIKSTPIFSSQGDNVTIRICRLGTTEYNATYWENGVLQTTWHNTTSNALDFDVIPNWFQWTDSVGYIYYMRYWKDTIQNDPTVEEIEINETPKIVNITNPLNNALLNNSPVNISFSLNFNSSACFLFSNSTGEFELRDSIITGVENITTTELVFNGTSLNPTAYYNFEESTGTTAVDIVNGFNGSIIGASYISSKEGNGTGNYSLDFDGANDYISIPDNDELTFTGAFSVFAWINMDVANPFRIGAKRTGVSPTEWFFTVDGSNLPRIQIYDESENSFIGMTGDSVASDLNNWIHLGFTYSGSGLSNGIKIYKNSIDITDLLSESGVFTSVENTNAFQEIGTINNFTSFADGSIDEFGLFGYELTTENVTQLFNNGVEINYINVTIITEINLTINSSQIQYLTEIIDFELTGYIDYFINCTYQNINISSQTNTYFFNNDFDIPIITLTYPITQFINDAEFINFTVNDYSSCLLNNSNWTLFYDNLTFFSFQSLNIADGDYTINISCLDNGNNYNDIVFNFTFDTVEPLIVLINPEENNKSVFEYNKSTGIKINFIDANLFSREVLIYNPINELIHNFTKLNIGATQEIFFKLLTFDKLGNWTMYITASDEHTKRKWFPEHSIKKTGKIIEFDFDVKNKNLKAKTKKNKVMIELLSDNKIDGWETEKLDDRYKFGLKFSDKTKKNKLQFKIKCDDLYYLEDSTYTAHFICYDTMTWIDFQSDKLINYEANKCGNNCYILDMGVDATDSITFNSIGGLNVNTKTVIFEVVEEIPSKFSFFSLDFSEFSNIALLFVFIFFYISLIVIAFTFRNPAFLTFAFLIGMFIGMSLVSIHALLTIGFMFMNILLLFGGIKTFK